MSKKPELNISVMQLCSSDDTSENQQIILEHLKTVPSSTDVVFLPENAIFMKISNKSPEVGVALSDPVYVPFKEWCKSTNTHILFGANPTQVPEGVANATIWITPEGDVKQVYSKIHLFDVDVEGQKPVRESDQFVPGSERSIIEIEGWKIGLSVCYDVRFSELYREYARQSVDIIAVPAAFLEPTGEAHWHVLLRARAIESQCFVVAAAQGGEHHGVGEARRRTYGHSLVVSPWGKVLLDMDLDLGAQTLSLNDQSLKNTREQIPMSSHRKL